MKIVSQKFCLVLAGAMLLLAGCKKPARPSPPDTSPLGLSPGGDNISQTGIATNAEGGEFVQRGNMGPEGDRTILKAVYFDFDRFNIKESERPKLQAAKEYLEKNPGTRVVFEGHADWRGTAEYNLSLGDRRANAAKKYVAGLGVAADKLEANSKGSLEAKQNATDADAANDRRVDLIVIKAP